MDPKQQMRQNRDPKMGPSIIVEAPAWELEQVLYLLVSEDFSHSGFYNLPERVAPLHICIRINVDRYVCIYPS